MMQQPIMNTDNVTNEIFSILERNFLFGSDDRKFISPEVSVTPVADGDGDGSINDYRGRVCVLSIDGGGMRSILAGKALAHLENALKEKSGDRNARIADYIDVAAGTGVGGVFTAMLFGTKDRRVPLFEAEETWRFMAEQGRRLYGNRSSATVSGGGSLFRRLFCGGRGGGGLSSATVAFETAMKEAFVDNGRSLSLKDTLKPVLIPCYDLSSSGPFMFSRADAMVTDTFDFRLWEVCRATSAEPDLFEPVLVKSVDGRTRCVAVDGGVVMSNPTATAITHILHNKQDFPYVHGVETMEDLLVLSLGTSRSPEGNYDYNQVKGWKGKDWARSVARVTRESLADVVDEAVALSFGRNRCRNYVRIQAHSNMGPNVDSDPGSSDLVGIVDQMLKQKNIESVLFGGKMISDHTNIEKLDWFAGELMLEHRRRSSVRPAVAFKETTT